MSTRKKLPLLHNKPLLARSSRVLRRSDSSKGRQLGLPSRTSSLIGADHNDTIIFLKEKCLPHLLVFAGCFFPCVLSTFYCYVFFPSCQQIAEAGTKDERSDRDVSDA